MSTLPPPLLSSSSSSSESTSSFVELLTHGSDGTPQTFAERWVATKLVNAGFTVATLRTVPGDALDLEFDVDLEALPLVSRQVEYGFVSVPRSGRLDVTSSSSMSVRLSRDRDSAPTDEPAEETTTTTRVRRNKALDKLKIRARGGSGAAALETAVQMKPTLERARRDFFNEYVRIWRASDENNAVWELALPLSEETLVALFSRHGAFYQSPNTELSAVGDILRRVRELTVDARPDHHTKFAQPDADVYGLSGFNRDAVEWLLRRGWLAYADGRVRLAGPALLTRPLAPSSMEFMGFPRERVWIDQKTGARLVDADDAAGLELERQFPGQVARRVHDWMDDRDVCVHKRIWVGLFALAKWGMPQTTLSRIRVAPPRSAPVIRASVPCMHREFPGRTWLVYGTSASPSITWRVERALGSRVVSTAAAAAVAASNAIPWRPSHGTMGVKFDVVALVATDQTSPKDVWSAWEACAGALILVGAKAAKWLALFET